MLGLAPPRMGAWNVGAELGRGSFGVVYEAQGADSRAAAIKLLERPTLDAGSPQSRRQFQRELDISTKLVHKNVVRVYDVLFTDDWVGLVMELCPSGELYQEVLRRGALPACAARAYFRQIMAGVAFCHDNGISHRDLKLENCLLCGSTVKICDFGLSKDAQQHSAPISSHVGSIAYMAPEVADASGRDAYDGTAADVWSSGVILYVMLCGQYPFGHTERGQPGYAAAYILLQRARKGAFSYPSWVEPSPLLEQLLRGMMAVHVAGRLSAQQVLRHPWMAEGQAAPPSPPSSVSAAPSLPSPRPASQPEDAIAEQESASVGAGHVLPGDFSLGFAIDALLTDEPEDEVCSVAWPTAWSAPREPALPSVASIFSDSESEDEEDCMYT